MGVSKHEQKVEDAANDVGREDDCGLTCRSFETSVISTAQEGTSADTRSLTVQPADSVKEDSNAWVLLLVLEGWVNDIGAQARSYSDLLTAIAGSAAAAHAFTAGTDQSERVVDVAQGVALATEDVA